MSLDKRFDGRIKITTQEGDYGDYYAWVNVYYYDAQTDSVKSDSVRIKVIGVTYPSDFTFSISGSSLR